MSVSSATGDGGDAVAGASYSTTGTLVASTAVAGASALPFTGLGLLETLLGGLVAIALGLVALVMAARKR